MKKITFIILVLLSINLHAQPVNNLPCNATELTVDLDGICTNDTFIFDGTETDSNIGTPNCATYSGYDLWYKFVMPNDGSVRIKTSSNNIIDDLALEVFSGSDCNNLVSIGCDDDGNPDPYPDDLFSQIDVVETAGSVIYFRVWDKDDLGEGSFNICLYKIPTPIIANNDECSTAETLNLTNDCTSPVLTTNFQATPSSEINPSCATNEGGDVWYVINVSNDKFYDIAIETSEDSGSSVLDTAIAVYTGSCGVLTEIGCDDDGGNNLFSKIDLNGMKGETLYVRVYPVQAGQTGTFYICATATETLGIENNTEPEFAMYPNPAKDIVNLKFNQSFSNLINIDTYNIQGKLVLSSKLQLKNNSSKLDVSKLTSGLYLLKIVDGERSITKKLFIN